MARSITSANAIILLTVDTIFPTPRQLQGFAADNIFETDAVANAETMMGVDGNLTAGWVPAAVPFNISFMADSPSVDVFDQWYQSEQSARTTYPCDLVVRLKSIGKSYALTRGFRMGASPLPTAARVLQPRRFSLQFERLTLAPI